MNRTIHAARKQSRLPTRALGSRIARQAIAGLLAILSSYLIPPSHGWADIVTYQVPESSLVLTLQGSTKFLPGGFLNYTHPKFGSIYFSIENTKVIKVPTLYRTCRKQLMQIRASKDANAAITLAHWALRHGMLKELYEAVDLALTFDPNNEEAVRIKELKQRMDQEIPEDPKLEEILLGEVPGSNFKIERSDHFILCHDTPENPDEKRIGRYRLNRADQRLQLLETVYESFLLKFYAQGYKLEIPQQRLMVLLFNEQEAFQEYAKKRSPALSNTSGFWNPVTNITAFFDHATAAEYQDLRELANQLQEQARKAKRSRQPSSRAIVLRSNAISLLVRIAQESSDIEVVSHEVTHQMAGNTGLFPRDVRIPRWVHEGLATYFETPNNAVWAGVGTVNQERLDWYRELAENDPEHASLDYIVGDRIFNLSGDIDSNILHAYGQAWALTYFLLDQHFDHLMQYYHHLGQFPPDTPLGHDILNELFTEVFGEDRQQLEQEWRAYMKTLKTDMEILLEEQDGAQAD